MNSEFSMMGQFQDHSAFNHTSLQQASMKGNLNTLPIMSEKVIKSKDEMKDE